ncbi:unnamed protein product [Durusdinium trenchii]|uniref:30S ribosomal protein S15 n=2 Tax=Durusdinium trenchii TaxID=1381693 RepID=A0ABP0SCQ5_9DINO
MRSSRVLASVVALAVAAVLLLAPSMAFSASPPPALAPASATAQRGSRSFQEPQVEVLPSTFSCGLMAFCVISAWSNARGKNQKVARAASLLDDMESMKQEEEEEEQLRKGGEARSTGKGNREEIKDYMDHSFEEADLEELAKEVEKEEMKDTSARQVKYDLFPSKQYVFYLAKKNAIKTWRSGPEGRNGGSLEVQIAVATEKIRNMILHMRQFKRDYKCRLKLVSLVCARRRMLDKLSVSNLESYMKIREELKIRHVYRIEALRMRLNSYIYAVRDRPPRPGRKTLNRLKKAKQRMSRRLATQLRQGREPKVIHRTQKKLNFRRWLARPYDEVKAWEKNNEVGTYVDPLNLP